MKPNETVIPSALTEPSEDLPPTMISLAEDFTATAIHAANWKDNYFGPTASSRLSQAVADMELATARIREGLR